MSLLAIAVKITLGTATALFFIGMVVGYRAAVTLRPELARPAAR